MLTQEQINAANFETMLHIQRVRDLLGEVCIEIIDRAKLHDQSKIREPEASGYAEVTHKLSGLTYGSPEYHENLKQANLVSVLEHHYANNRHHPQHHKNGVDDMTLVDLIEMLVDWKAASERHNDGNIKKSIEHNANRFNMSPQLVKIFENTAKELF